MSSQSLVQDFASAASVCQKQRLSIHRKGKAVDLQNLE